MEKFSVALFSDPPSVFPIVLKFLKARVDLACVVSFFPRGNILKIPDALKKELNRREIPVVLPDTLRSADVQRKILDTKPSVIATIGGLVEKIPKAILTKVPGGGLNWHPSLLPKYRGPFPCFWPIYNGEPETGNCIHEMTDQFDAGDIFMRQKIKIEPDETHGSLWMKCEAAGVKLMLNAISELRNGKKLPRIPQDPAKATQAPIPGLDILRIDWTKPAEKILALIRAASPALGAQFQFKNTIVKVWSAKMSRRNEAGVEPGTVSTKNGVFEVAAPDHFISLETLQIGFLRFASGQEFLSLSGIREGEPICKTC